MSTEKENKKEVTKTEVPKESELLGIITAFQAFGGKPLKVLDAVEALSDDEILVITIALHKMADWLRQKGSEWPELLTLAEQIERRLNMNVI